MARKKTKGRQKLEMVKMTNATRLQVTFSKRRSDLFKKASELCTLCGAEVAIIAFSPGNKVHSFGHPCVKALIQRFEYRQQHVHSGEMQMIDAYRQATLSNLTSELSSIEQMLEEEICQAFKVRQAENWWENPIKDLDMKQLELLMEQLEELKTKVAMEAIEQLEPVSC